MLTCPSLRAAASAAVVVLCCALVAGGLDSEWPAVAKIISPDIVTRGAVFHITDQVALMPARTTAELVRNRQSHSDSSNERAAEGRSGPAETSGWLAAAVCLLTGWLIVIDFACALWLLSFRS